MAGEKAEKLVAAVREVQEAQTLGGNAYPLFSAMGFKMQYQVMRRGLRYTMLVGAQVVELSLMVLEGQGEDGQPAVVVPGLWLVRSAARTRLGGAERACPARISWRRAARRRRRRIRTRSRRLRW